MREDVTVTRGGDVLLSGVAVLDVATALELVAAVHRNNGGAGATRLASLMEPFTTAARRVQSFVVETAKPSELVAVPESALADPISSDEAAQLLGCSPQNFTKHCRRGTYDTARRTGRTWLIERSEVLAVSERIAS
ncbi:helix-turn-helix domain-containing protein [uncultured Jatrophihabitans sp.]|uniref:helix-turn-helix domain-containing protein n=1 Tax=uncultured Jatrophihabitans sp. TaxID=1610747 RepID=UPI0035CB2103